MGLSSSLKNFMLQTEHWDTFTFIWSSAFPFFVFFFFAQSCSFACCCLWGHNKIYIVKYICLDVYIYMYLQHFEYFCPLAMPLCLIPFSFKFSFTKNRKQRQRRCFVWVFNGRWLHWHTLYLFPSDPQPYALFRFPSSGPGKWVNEIELARK